VSGPSPAATAPLARRLLRVTANEQLGAYRVLRATDPDADGRPAAPQPGQFAMLSAAERWGGGDEQRPFLARAFSIARHEDGGSHFLIEDVGPGTKRLCELRAGDQLWVLGPLGQGFQPPQEGRRAILVGGGVGIAPLAILQDQLTAPVGSGTPTASAMPLAVATPVTVLLGFRDEAHAHGAALLRDALIATDDGSVGHRGLVTDLLATELDEDPHATVYACGPPGMLEGVRAMCETRETPSQLALEAGMACGFGACFGCVVPKRGGGYLRVCVDGPVVDGAALERVEEPGGGALLAGRA
jgi:dihydroorotate dehydrogenase electron transfer subunit